MVAIAGSSGYALKSDGTVWAWGGNVSGGLGNGTSVSYSNVPVRVSSLSGSRPSPPVTVNGTPPGTGVPSGSEYPYRPE
ncbi:MAG: RCC1 domain-containing protein [Thermaerobacter sp.]|nr:RCC1 domain-containing protein [Thermaerobacter sp.]MDA8145684.1 RCC1 domain-containing protein [Thermaerobacter sp.]